MNLPTPGITPKAPPLSQLAIFVVYGYSGSQKVKANRALLRTTHARIREYRKSTPWGSVLVGGDLNVCLSNNLDTDRPDLHTDADEPEAEVLRTFICTGRPIPLPSPTSKGSHAHLGRRTARPSPTPTRLCARDPRARPTWYPYGHPRRVHVHLGWWPSPRNLRPAHQLSRPSPPTCPNMAAPHLLQTKTPP